MKLPGGSWAVTSLDKAEAFADSFSSKWCLPGPEQNIHSDLSAVVVPQEQDRFLRIRVRFARYILEALRQDSGTGPDLLPARVLKVCANNWLFQCVS